MTQSKECVIDIAICHFTVMLKYTLPCFLLQPFLPFKF